MNHNPHLCFFTVWDKKHVEPPLRRHGVLYVRMLQVNLIIPVNQSTITSVNHIYPVLGNGRTFDGEAFTAGVKWPYGQLKQLLGSLSDDLSLAITAANRKSSISVLFNDTGCFNIYSAAVSQASQ